MKGEADVVESNVQQAAEPAPGQPVALSAGRAWFFLVWLCIQRQARIRQMVWIALALLGVMVTIVTLTTMSGRWSVGTWSRWVWIDPPPRSLFGNNLTEEKKGPAPNDKVEFKNTQGMKPPRGISLTYGQIASGMQLLPRAVPWLPAPAMAIEDGISGALQEVVQHTDFWVFSNNIVFSVFLGFLLPIWSLSFATEALGGEREDHSLVWLLTRPLSRSSIYIAKFVALLPWSLALNLGGFGLLCALGDRPGHLAFELYWRAVLWGTLAFCALFHFMGACFRRPTIVALVYSFFLEIILGSMPGYMKRISIGFYTRCLMFEAGGNYNVAPERPSIYLPVDGSSALWVLVGLTVLFLLAGCLVFARSEYQDLT